MRRSVFLLPFVGACYTYAPSTTTAAMPGMPVRTRITPAASERIAPLFIGMTAAMPRVLAGTVVENFNGELTVEVPSVVPTTAQTAEVLHQLVRLAPADVVEVETRRLDRTKTALLVGGIVIAGGAIAVSALGHGVDEGVHPPGETGTENRRPLVRIRIP